MHYLYYLIITPIETIVEWIFLFITRKMSSLGIMGAIAGVSLIINFLALPLYNVADSLQEKERKIAKSLEYRVKRIKKAFKGDERFMMLSAYYRQNNYNPIFVLRSSLSILIEIPFFIAAYHYLSHNEMLQGANFWIFKDLGAPDTFFSIFGLQIHILPIIMTLINFVSGAVYTRDAPIREKLQLFGIASVFLVLLYNSPSGLVIYWILNNLFSLAKNIVMKMKNPGKILHGIISIILITITFYFILGDGKTLKKTILFLLTIMIILLPKIKILLFNNKSFPNIRFKNRFYIFVLSSLGLTLLCGLLIPSCTISTSPIEFSYLGNTNNPINYILFTFSVFSGFFIFWPILIYNLFNEKIKNAISLVFFIFFIGALANVFIFKVNYGNLTTNFIIDNRNNLKVNSLLQIILPILLFIASIILYFSKLNKILPFMILSISISQFSIGIYKLILIKKSYTAYNQSINYSKQKIEKDIYPIYQLSKNKKNVIIVFLDRVSSFFFQKAIDENIILKNQLSGFIYYPNTLSMGQSTYTGFPPVMGGYDYIPEKIVSRDTELLRDKHNEASLVLPKLFLDSGYKITITDPPLPNYSWKGDLSGFMIFPEMNVQELQGIYYSKYVNDNASLNKMKSSDDCTRKGIVNFSILQILYRPFKLTFYDSIKNADLKNFIDNFSSLYYLNSLTTFDSPIETFTFIGNESIHNPVLFNDNFTIPIDYCENHSFLGNYQTTIAVIKQLEVYFNFLKENNVYNNTRIIIVSDHGLINSKRFDSYNPLLLVKDFNSMEELRIDESFMTNADTLFLATENLDISKINPFSNKELINIKSEGINCFPSIGNDSNPTYMVNKTKYTLDKSNAFHVHDNIFNPDNWIPLTEWERKQGKGDSQ